MRNKIVFEKSNKNFLHNKETRDKKSRKLDKQFFDPFSVLRNINDFLQLRQLNKDLERDDTLSTPRSDETSVLSRNGFYCIN